MSRALKGLWLTSLLSLLLVVAGNAQAWWGTPYGGYWPNAWPGQNVWPGQYGQPGFNPGGVHRWGYGGPGWNMRGYMTDRGDMHFVIEYRGNVNRDFFGGHGGYPGYGAYRQPPPAFYGSGWR